MIKTYKFKVRKNNNANTLNTYFSKSNFIWNKMVILSKHLFNWKVRTYLPEPIHNNPRPIWESAHKADKTLLFKDFVKQTNVKYKDIPGILSLQNSLDHVEEIIPVWPESTPEQLATRQILLNILRNTLSELINGTLKKDGTPWKAGATEFRNPFNFSNFELMSLRKHIYTAYPWLSEGDTLPAQSANMICERLAITLDNFWKKGGFWGLQFGRNPADRKGFPKFLDRNDHTSISFSKQTLGKIQVTGRNLSIYGMSFQLWKLHRPVVGEIRDIKISKDALGHIWICISSAINETNSVIPTGTPHKVTLDASSTGIQIDEPTMETDVNAFVAVNNKRIQKLMSVKTRIQISMSHKQAEAQRRMPVGERLKNFLLTCQNYQKDYKRFLKICERLNNLKKNTLHQISHDIVAGSNEIELSYKRSAKKIKYTVKSDIIKDILSKQYSALKSMIEYKAEEKGILINTEERELSLVSQLSPG